MSREGWNSKPDVFEPYLEAHPEDRAHRSAALIWYGIHAPDRSKLKEHTRAMARHHPDGGALGAANHDAFIAEPGYRTEVLALLESEYESGKRQHGLLSNLSQLCEAGAIAPRFETEIDRKRYLEYFGLPSDHVFATDTERARKAVAYLEEALAVAEASSPEYVSAYAMGLVSLFEQLDRPNDALELSARLRAKPDRPPCSRAHLDYATSALKLGRIDDAERAFRQAIAESASGFVPGDGAIHGHLGLGEIALVHRRCPRTAAEHLLAAACVAPNWHTAKFGLPLRLARLLLAEGQDASVQRFCKIVLANVCSGHAETQAMLDEVHGARAPRS